MTDVSPTATATQKKKGIFPGYWLVAAASIMFGWGHVIQQQSFGVFVKPLSQAFGWSRAEISFAQSFARLEGGIEGPFAGIATDKWGPRAVKMVGFFLLGLGFVLMYFVNSLWMFYVVWVFGALGGNVMGGPLDAAVANWFVKRRGTMIAIVRSTVPFLAPVMLPAITWLFFAYGWRPGFVVLGLSIWIVGLPLTWFFIKPKRPEYYGWLPDGKRIDESIAGNTDAMLAKGAEYAAETTGEVEFTARQAMRDKTFWIIVASATLRGMVSSAINIHLIPMLTDQGIDEMMAATAMGAMVFMTLPGRLFFGWAGDHVSIKRLKYLPMVTNSLAAVGIFILTIAKTMPLFWTYVVVYGLGHGGDIVVWTPIRGKYYGRKAFATIQGLISALTMVGGIIAPVYAGWAYDTTGSYIFAFQLFLTFMAIAAVIMFFANPPKRPEKIGKVTDIV